MRLENRQFRFVLPFLSLRPRRAVRLGGKRGSVQLQETALVVEGELLRFTFFLGLEWLFRRALSEWTTITVPYSRVVTVRLTRLWPLRVVTALFVAAWITLIAAFWETEDDVAMIMVLGFALLALLLYLNFRIRRSIQILFQGRERRRLFAIVIRKKPLRAAFLASLHTHRDAAERFRTV